MLVSGIKSKPTYEALRADARGRYHLMAGLGSGAVALRRVLDELRAVDPSALSRTRVLFAQGPDAAHGSGAAGGLGGTADLEGITAFDAVPPLLTDLRRVLDQSLMGTRLYIAGPESFIGRVLQVASEFNLNKDEVRAEESGTLARRVRCVHCRAITENVRTNIVQCDGCARWLLVRDHYSRRLAAYMGVMVDAEAPGELPPILELYP